MKFLFYLGHPAHYHLFRNVILNLERKGHSLVILIKKKDILEELLKEAGIPFLNILPEGRKDSKTGIAWGLIKRDFRLLRYCAMHRPDLMIGTSTEITHVGKLLNIPSVNVNEDDADVVPLYSKLSYPFASCIVSPDVCENGKWDHKSVKYPGYHELAYLHPGHFSPSGEIAGKYVNTGEPYFIIRFAKLTAHHDTGIRGISPEIASGIIDILKPHGTIYITSERPLEPGFEPYRLRCNVLDIHHVMAFARIYIGDSQTMAAEAGVLGTPFVRFNDFVGRIGYLRDLEDHYRLGFGVKASEPGKLKETILELVRIPDIRNEWKARREKMLSEKIDTAAFLTWFLEGYPGTLREWRENADLWKKFQ